MLSSIDFKKKDITKEEYKAQHDELLDKLVVLQQKARQEGLGLVVLYEGLVGGGRGTYISDMMYSLDARATSVYSTLGKKEELTSTLEKLDNGVLADAPIMAEFWENLGQRNDFTFFDGGWYSRYTQCGIELMNGLEYDEACGVKLSKTVKQASIKRITKYILKEGVQSCGEFERQIEDDGYLLVKFYNHDSRKGINGNIKGLQSNQTTSWLAEGMELISKKDYELSCKFIDALLENSNFDFAPWVMLNGETPRQSTLIVLSTLCSKLEEALAKKEVEKAAAESAALPEDLHELAPKQSAYPIVANYPTVDSIRHDLTMTREEYKQRLKPLQKRFAELQCIAMSKNIPIILTFEGWDAAGKGGSIKRIAQALDARIYKIFPSPSPTKAELAHPHLWRYWTRLPKAGFVGLYDRTWYGRVLVERIEGFTTPERWAQGYDEINAFEKDLVDWGAILIKFWVDISPDEQLKRFEARQADPDKQWKITDEDWRNREKYPQYKSAIDDMFRLTSTSFAPWTILESESKYYARIKALETVVAALEDRLNMDIDF